MTWVAVAVVGGAVVGGVAANMAADTQAGAAESAAASSAASAANATQLQGKIYDQNRADQQPWRQGGQSALQKLLGGMGIDVPVDGGSTPLTRQQVYDKLIPDYQTTTGEGQSLERYWDENTGSYNYRLVGVPAGKVTDTNALNAAVDKEYARLNSGQMRARDSDFGTLTQDFSMAEYEADPGYAFRVAEGQKALERSAAARGGLYSGRAAKDLTRFGQDSGSQEYQNAYNRYQSNQTNQFNRLASLAGVGQTANNALATAGTNYANSVGNIGMTNAANQENAAMAAANANASGYTGMANSLGSAAQGLSRVNWGTTNSAPTTSSAYNGWNAPDTYSYGGVYE